MTERGIWLGMSPGGKTAFSRFWMQRHAEGKIQAHDPKSMGMSHRDEQGDYFRKIVQEALEQLGYEEKDPELIGPWGPTYINRLAHILEAILSRDGVVS